MSKTPGEVLYEAIEEWRRDDLRLVLSDVACDLLLARFNIKMALERESAKDAASRS